TDLEDGAIVVVAVVHVGLVPRLELAEALQDRVVGRDVHRREDLATVTLEAGADEFDEFAGVAEAGRRAMDGQEAAALRNVVEERLFLRGAEARPVGVEQHGVELAEELRTQRLVETLAV